MQPDLATSLLLAFAFGTVCSIAAWSGSACSDLDTAFLEDEADSPVLIPPERAFNGRCVTFDKRLPANCDVYLCVDPQHNEQGDAGGSQECRNKRTESEEFPGFPSWMPVSIRRYVEPLQFRAPSPRDPTENSQEPIR